MLERFIYKSLDTGKPDGSELTHEVEDDNQPDTAGEEG
jgi:hypothetical protein